MKGYRRFVTIFVVLLAIYVVAEINRPQPIQWTITLSKSDKNPYGGYVLYNRLKDIFPNASIQSFRLPVYDQVNNFEETNTAYILCADILEASKNDIHEMLNYVAVGNYVLLSTSFLSKQLADTLHIKKKSVVNLLETDSTVINFSNPSLKTNAGYTFRKSMIDDYFADFDTANAVVLGFNNSNRANFLQVNVGDGKIFIHANPIVFSNYFMLHHDNESYTSKVLSYLPADISLIYWDEFYKLGPDGASSPLRLFLTNPFLLWALRLSLLGMLIYVFFEMKRRQRIIPIITPLQNTTLAFIKTVASVYFQQKDNKSIGVKKISYFLEFVRGKYFLQTNMLDDQFINQLSGKSGMDENDLRQLIKVIEEIQGAEKVSDNFLMLLNQKIDQFYKQVI